MHNFVDKYIGIYGKEALLQHEVQEGEAIKGSFDAAARALQGWSKGGKNAIRLVNDMIKLHCNEALLNHENKKGKQEEGS